jgi:hypothetical protein
MAIRNHHSVLCCIMALLLPATTLWAQDTSTGRAILSPTGIVSINGDLVNNSSALLGNETVSTGPESAAHITSPGTNTILAAGTVVGYSHDVIHLTSGSVLISTTSGMFAEVGKLKFGPAKPGALTKFEVQSAGCAVTVIARLGSVSLPDGRVLAQGESDLSNNDCEVAKGTGHPAAAAHHIPPYVYWGLAGAGAAGTVAGVALLNSGSSKAAPVSPSRP